MRPDALRSLRLTLVCALLTAGALGMSPAEPHAQGLNFGVAWQPLTLQQALAEAQASGKRVLVEVWAEHCHSCKDMETEVWQTAEGLALTSNAIPIKINSTTPEGQALAQLYPVLGLPLTLFLNEDGTEFDRVAGYDGAQAFLRDANPISGGIDNLIALEKRLALRPTDPAAMFEILEKYLARKREADAQKMLERIFAADPTNAMAIGERAIGEMARYQSYFKRDHNATYAIWTGLLDRYPNASSAGGAIDGAFKAAQALGKTAEWKSWLCGVTAKYPKNGQLQQSAALNASRNKVIDPCFATAARAAIALGMKAPNLAAIAAEMDGKTDAK